MLLLLFAVAVLAGAINSVAGGGSFLTLPALLFAGVTPIVANATSTAGHAGPDRSRALSPTGAS